MNKPPPGHIHCGECFGGKRNWSHAHGWTPCANCKAKGYHKPRTDRQRAALQRFEKP